MTQRTFQAALLLAAVSWLGACSSPTSSTELSVDVTANPDPATASESHGVTYQVTNADSTYSTYEYSYRASFTATIQETGGTALDITALDLKVQQATGGIVITPSGGDQIYFKFNSSAVTNHINAKGSADVGFDVWYRLPNGGREALVTVGMSFKDKDDNTYSKTLQVKIAP